MGGRSLGRLLFGVAAAFMMIAPSTAGTLSVTWDAVPAASGYRIYYGTASGQYSGSITSPTTSATISGLQDCTQYFVAVKAYNGAGESPQYSNELAGWSRPVVTTVTPTTAKQGDQIVMDIFGNNFQPGALPDLGNPNVFLSSVSVLSCTHLQLIASVEPTVGGIRPAEVGKLDVVVTNPDAVFGSALQAFEVLINPRRFDINRSDAMTANRVDGKDTVYISRHFGLAETDPNYDPDHDFDGDGWVDGSDLAYIASNLGKCWSSIAGMWSLAACPTSLQ